MLVRSHREAPFFAVASIFCCDLLNSLHLQLRLYLPNFWQRKQEKKDNRSNQDRPQRDMDRIVILVISFQPQVGLLRGLFRQFMAPSPEVVRVSRASFVSLEKR
jgi:hypothetical protein